MSNGWTVNLSANTESYGGSAAPVIVTDPPAIPWGFTRSSFTPNVPNVTAVTNVPTMLRKAGPWMEFRSSGNPQNSGLPAGTQSVPYFTPGLVLPKDHSAVNVQMFDAHGSGDSRVNDFQMNLDPGVFVVPVHVHILRDANGNTPSNYAFLLRGSDAEVEWNVRQQFDLSAVRYGSTVIGLTPTEVSMSVTRAVADPFAKRTGIGAGNVEIPIVGDDIYAQCGVQLRLASVTFLRQSMGLEQALLSNAEEPAVCNDDSLCTKARIAQIGAPLRDAFDAQPSLGRGIHVFLGGPIFPGASWCGAPIGGLTCNSAGGRMVFIDATGSVCGGFTMNTVFHEIGHVLTHSSAHKSDQNNLMFQYCATAGGLLTQDQCDTIRPTAAGY